MLAEELGLDRRAWFLHMLKDGRERGEPVDLGVLMRAYWELQRISGRPDIEGSGVGSPTRSARRRRLVRRVTETVSERCCARTDTSLR